jgi:hypothetical protein
MLPTLEPLRLLGWLMGLEPTTAGITILVSPFVITREALRHKGFKGSQGI